ncbi:MAG: radical SAM protein [Candidatus Nitrosocaldaceae archaeon]|nr:MAG: radical SAM protein [Candidatus Nitrosocaldaceae archaeon]
MVDLIYGRSFTELIDEIPLYFSLARKYIGIKLLHEKHAIFGSADIVNVCNLHCKHCYWWLNRKEEEGLSAEEWRNVIHNVFKKHKVFNVTLVGGEPLLRPDVIEVFCEEMPRQICVVTNGTYPIKHFDGLYFYWVSIDGNEEVHDKIRGKGAYSKTRKNILDYINSDKKGKPAWKDIWLSYTINSLNYNCIEDVIKEWHNKVNKIAFQFHTPFMKNDPLALPFGKERNKVIDNLIRLQKQYKNFIMNPPEQLSLFKGNWGGIGNIPTKCPIYAILAVDHMGRIKQPCCIGSADPNAQKPICEECGLGCYSVLVTRGITG